MRRRMLVIALFACFLSPLPANAQKSDYYVCAYVWPSCHDDSLARKWIWPEGEGEWEVIRKGNPRFEGHYQPRMPLLGYGHDDDPEVVEKWIQLALGHDINTFIYDWYWFRDPDGYSGPFLEDALDKGFLGAPSNGKMNFYLMYANHDVKYSYWNYHKWGAAADSLLFNPRIGMEDWRKVVDRVITKYFHLPNYVKIDGCPVFAIFNTGIFEQGFSSPEEAAAAMDYFREEVKKAGFPGLHVQLTPGGGSDPSSRPGGGWAGGIDRYKINSIAFYNMGGFNPDYEIQNRNAVRIRNRVDTLYSIPLFPTVSIGWDDTPRFPRKGEKDVTHINYNPQIFEKYLKIAKDYADAHRDTQPPFVMINAWNEWVEGSYLLPDQKWGYGYLDAVKHIFAEPDFTKILPPWQEGYFDIHHISTGKGECQFLVFPDGTTMVIDCGDMTGQGRGWAHSRALPGNALSPAKWAARYIDTFSPKPGELDYVVVSHFHDDHMGHKSASFEGPDGYRLCGITELAEYEKFGTLVDRGYPTYDFPSVEKVEKQCTMMKDYKKFVALKVRSGMRAERFKTGTHKQFRTHSGKWDFDVWNVASNLKVTAGGRKVKDMHTKGDDPLRFDENMFSSVMLFRYGAFKYYSGGDLPGGNLPALKFDRDFESLVAPVVGRCNVVKADHHGYRDSMNPYFLWTTAPDVIVVDAAEASHPRAETVQRVTDPLGRGKRLLYTTSEAGRAKMGEELWCGISGTGHIVIRVFPRGDRYKLYVLDATSADYPILYESEFLESK